MAYLPGFKHDVFISYAHVNDHRHWVERFHHELVNLLAQHLGRRESVSVWIDEKKLTRNNVFENTIDNAWRDSAVLVSLLSPAYLESSYCLKELNGFCELAEHSGIGIHVEDQSRVVTVKLQDVMHLEVPDVFHQTQGYMFFEPNPPNQWTKQFRPTEFNDHDQRYWNALDTLAGDICDLLRLMKQRVLVEANEAASLQPQAMPISPSTQTAVSTSVPRRQSPPLTSQAENQGAIFLAESTDDLADERQLLEVEMKQAGIRVFPERPLPREAEALREKLDEIRKQVSVSVHPFGPLYGEPVFGDPLERSLGEFQFDVLHEALPDDEASLSLQVAWIPDDFDVNLPAQRQARLLKRISDLPRKGLPFELLRRDLEELKEFLRNRMLARQQQRHRSRGPLVYIAVHPDDTSRDEIPVMLNCCREHRCDAFYSTGKQEPVARERRDRTHFRNADGILILYGNCPTDWVTDRAVAALEATDEHDARSLRLGVCDGPPPDKEHLPFAFSNVEIINIRNKQDSNCLCNELTPFLRGLEGHR